MRGIIRTICFPPIVLANLGKNLGKTTREAVVARSYGYQPRSGEYVTPITLRRLFYYDNIVTGGTPLLSHPIVSPPPLTSPLTLRPCRPYACLTPPYASLTGARIVPPHVATRRAVTRGVMIRACRTRGVRMIFVRCTTGGCGIFLLRDCDWSVDAVYSF